MIHWINAIASTWAHMFWVMNLQNSLFLLITLAILHKLRNQSPKVTSLIALIALVKMLIPPINSVSLSGLVPSSTIPYLNILPGAITPGETSIQQSRLSITGIFFLLWSIMSLVMLSIYFYRYFRFKQYALNGKGMDTQTASFHQMAYPVVFSSRCQSPYVIGFFRPQIVLPAEAARWQPRYLETIIAHEIAHVYQRDQWVNLLQVVVQSLYFFNPLVWFLNRQIIYFREMQTDNSAIRRLKIAPHDYARRLLQIAEELMVPENNLSSPVSFIKTASSLKQRIIYQLDRKEDSMSRKWIFQYSVIVLGLFMLMLPLSCDLSSTAPKEPPIVSFAEVTKKPEVVKRVSAQYPESAKTAGLQGNVVLKMLIGGDGRVQEVKVLKSDSPELEAAAIDAAKQFVFTPAEKDGEPVRVWLAVPFTFKLK